MAHLRAMFPCDDLPELNVPTRLWNRAVVYTGIGKSFRGREDDDPMLCGVQCAYAYYRHATEQEIAALEAKERGDAADDAYRQQREAELKAVAARIQAEGERPVLTSAPAGEIWHDTDSGHGVGECFVITATELWYVKSNGMDGDCWARNNIPGAIAWRVPYSEEIAAEIRGI